MTDHGRLKTGLETLTVFASLRSDPVISALYAYLSAPDPGKYSKMVSTLYEANGGALGDYVRSVCEECNTFYVRMRGQGKEVSSYVEESLTSELATLQRVAGRTPCRVGLEWISAGVFLRRSGYFPIVPSTNGADWKIRLWYFCQTPDVLPGGGRFDCPGETSG